MSVPISQTASELLDYTINWPARGLGTDTIASSTWATSSSDITISNQQIINSNTQTLFWLTGGVAGTVYTITNTIITSGGRTMQETVNYYCEAQRII